MNDDLKYYTTKNLTNSMVFHGFFTRLGGVSKGSIAGLNCGLGSQDDMNHVIENRRRVASESKQGSENLLSVYQVHGNNVITVTEKWINDDNRPKADAMVADKKDLLLGIVTADCAPVLFSTEKGDGSPVIGAAHAGWRGAVGGILDNTIDAMIALGGSKEKMKASIGPCIGRKSYEVDESFVEPFLNEVEENERFFSAAKSGHKLMFDLSGYCASKLARLDIKNVEILDKDTYLNEEEFYSYRRSTHKNEPDYGRQISIIGIV